MSNTFTQACNQGGEGPLKKFSPPLEKGVGHSLKILVMVQKIWAHLGKLFAPPGFPIWLRACIDLLMAPAAISLKRQELTN